MAPGPREIFALKRGMRMIPFILYFQEVGRFSLLTREEEIQIAKRIEISQEKVAQAENAIQNCEKQLGSTPRRN